MQWEIPVLLSFLLLFNIGLVDSPSNTNFVIDSYGVKHYVLTPAVSNHNKYFEGLTNVLFQKYENPWEQNDTALVVGSMAIFLLIVISIIKAVNPIFIQFSNLEKRKSSSQKNSFDPNDDVDFKNKIMHSNSEILINLQKKINIE